MGTQLFIKNEGAGMKSAPSQEKHVLLGDCTMILYIGFVLIKAIEEEWRLKARTALFNEKELQVESPFLRQPALRPPAPLGQRGEGQDFARQAGAWGCLLRGGGGRAVSDR